MEILLHSGLEHPNTLWIAVGVVVAFVFGVAAGVYRRSITNPFSDTAEE